METGHVLSALGADSQQPEQANGIAQDGRKHEQDDWCKQPFDWNFVTADRQGKRLDFFRSINLLPKMAS